MDSRTLQIVLQLKDQASAGFKKLNDSLKQNEATIKGVGVASAAVFAGLGAIAAKSISDYGDAEKSAKQLEHAVIDVSHATQAQLAATSDLADALERKGVLDGDNIKMGLAQLSTFGLSNTAVQGLAGSLADLAVNQFGVNASGEQLSDTANMIAKALNGQFGVLEKSGIRFNEAQRHMIMFGTEMEKVKAINEGFSQNLKYTNDVALTTMEGKLAKAKVQLGNISEALGGSLQEALNSTLVVLAPFIQKLLDFVTAHPKIVAAIFGIVAAVTGLTAVVSALALATVAFTAVAWPIVGIIALIVAGIIALVAIGYELYTHWDQIKAFAIEVWGSIANVFTETWASISGTVSGALDAIFQVFQTVFNAIATFVGFIINFIAGAIITDLDALFPHWQEFLLSLYDAWVAAWMSVLTYISNVVLPAIRAVLASISEAWSSAWGAISQFFTGVWNSIKTTIGGAIDYIIDKINSLIAKAAEISGKVLSPIQKALSAAGGATSSAGKAVGSAINAVAATGAKVTKVNDAVITPNGQVIQTHPDDYLFATKTPGSMGGGSVIVQIMGGYYLDQGAATEIGNALAKQIGQQLKLRTI